jgi:hypothetical protein
MSPRVTYWLGLCGGAGLTGGSLSLHADWYGKEGYAKYVLDNWSPERVSVPIGVGAILAFGFGLIVVWRKTRPSARVEPRIRSMYIVAPTVGDEKVTLVTERVGQPPSRLDFSIKAATDLSLLFGAAVQAAKGAPEAPKPDPARPTSWEKIDLLDD